MASACGSSSPTDYEQLTYDAGSNPTTLRLRDNTSISMQYDNLSRLRVKNLPGTEPDVTFTYDNLGQLLSANQTGLMLSFTYDALGRKLTETGPQGTVASVYDAAGRRTKLTLGNGAVSDYDFDTISNLHKLLVNPFGTTADLTVDLSYNVAGQITQAVRSNDLYTVTPAVGTTTYTLNGLNQITAVNGSAVAHDLRGNMTADGLGGTYTYSSQNLMTTAGVYSFTYDPLTRLHGHAGGAQPALRVQYDGLSRIAEYSTSGAIQRRFVFGPGIDEPLVWYEGGVTCAPDCYQSEVESRSFMMIA